MKLAERPTDQSTARSVWSLGHLAKFIKHRTTAIGQSTLLLHVYPTATELLEKQLGRDDVFWCPYATLLNSAGRNHLCGDRSGTGCIDIACARLPPRI